MSVNCIKMPIFVEELNTQDKKSYVNINDISNIYQARDNYWVAQSRSGRNPYGGSITYHFDNVNAAKIINYTA